MTTPLDKLIQVPSAKIAINLDLVFAILSVAVIASFILVFSGQLYAIGIEGILGQFAAIKDAALNVHLHIRALSRVAKHLRHRLCVGARE